MPKSADINKCATNVDFLSCGDKCRRNCRQCFLKEVKGPGFNGSEKEFIRSFLMEPALSKYFIYPPEIATSLEFLPLMREIGQKKVLTTGLDIGRKPEILDLLEEYGIREIKVTLFADTAEQRFMNRNSQEEYELIKRAVRESSLRGFDVTATNIIYRDNIDSIPNICDLSYTLGAKKVSFMRLLPVGNAKKMPVELFPRSEDVEKAYQTIEKQKERYAKDELYISMGLSFGPDFSKNSMKRFLDGERDDWVNSRYLCPAINADYAGISLKTANIYSCFMMVSDPKFVIGRIEKEKQNKIVIDPAKKALMSEETLKGRLRGKCSRESCAYQDLCLGGCRAVAYSMAKIKDEKEPLYAGMDFCRSNRIMKEKL